MGRHGGTDLNAVAREVVLHLSLCQNRTKTIHHVEVRKRLSIQEDEQRAGEIATVVQIG